MVKPCSTEDHGAEGKAFRWPDAAQRCMAPQQLGGDCTSQVLSRCSWSYVSDATESDGITAVVVIMYYSGQSNVHNNAGTITCCCDGRCRGSRDGRQDCWRRNWQLNRDDGRFCDEHLRHSRLRGQGV